MPVSSGRPQADSRRPPPTLRGPTLPPARPWRLIMIWPSAAARRLQSHGGATRQAPEPAHVPWGTAHEVSADRRFADFIGALLVRAGFVKFDQDSVAANGDAQGLVINGKHASAEVASAGFAAGDVGAVGVRRAGPASPGHARLATCAGAIASAAVREIARRARAIRDAASTSQACAAAEAWRAVR